MVVIKGHTYLNKAVALSFAPLHLLGIAFVEVVSVHCSEAYVELPQHLRWSSL